MYFTIISNTSTAKTVEVMCTNHDLATVCNYMSGVDAKNNFAKIVQM